MPALPVILVLGLVIIPSCTSGRAWAQGRTEVVTDLEGDGRRERLVLAAAGPHSLTIRREGKIVWRGIPRKWNPWKVQAADVDGDGIKEIVLGVHKGTRFFPQPHNCLFVFGWDGKQAFPKWLGSRLSKPFVDFTLAQLDGEPGDELVSLEVTRGGRRCLVVYSWCGFGFAGDWQSPGFARARLSRDRRGRVILAVPGGGKRVLMRQGKSYRLEKTPIRESRCLPEPTRSRRG